MGRANFPNPQFDDEAGLTLNLLNAVDADSGLTQRTAAKELGVALGLVNSYLKRCIKKGLIKVQQAPANRYAYYLTPKGLSEKSRLTTEFLKQSFIFFRFAREETSQLLARCGERGWTRIALAGKSELAEVAVLGAAEAGIDMVGIIDPVAAATTSTFMQIPVVTRASDLDRRVQAILITDIARPQAVFEEAIKFFPRERVLAAPLLEIRDSTHSGNGEAES